jgi:hypothetical protein
MASTKSKKTVTRSRPVKTAKRKSYSRIRLALLKASTRFASEVSVL